MALLSMRARKFYQRIGRKIIIDGSNTAGYHKSKVECFNCHKMGHFTRECRAPRSKDNRNWNQGSSTKTANIEDASEKAMCAIDGAGFDWSDMAEEEIQANMALMAFLDSEVKNDKSCSKNCLKNYEALKKQYDDLLVKLSDTDFKIATYKRRLVTLEGQIVKYREHEVLFSEEIALLKRSVGCKEYELGLLKTELEKVKQEKERVDFKIAKFDKSAKDLNEMLESQITDKSKKGVGYHAVPSPHPLILNRPTTLDLSYSGLEEFKEPEVNEYGPRDSSLKPTTGCDKESDNSKGNTDDSLEQHQMTDTKTSSFESQLKDNDALIIEDWVSDDEDEVESPVVVKKKTIIPTAAKIDKPVIKPVRYAEMEGFNAVKPLSIVGVGDHQPNGASTVFNKINYIDDPWQNPMMLKGHMTGNIAIFSFKELCMEVMLILVGGAYRGKNYSKGTILKLIILDFDVVYFVKELKLKPLRCSKCVTKRNYVLFTDLNEHFLMTLQDASYFGDAEPRSIADAQIQDKDGLHDENDATEKSYDDSSLKDNGTAVQQVNTARPEINTGSRVLVLLSLKLICCPEDLVIEQLVQVGLLKQEDERGTVIRTSKYLLPQGYILKIEEEVLYIQPPGFEDPDHPDKVYKVVKALYVLHQAPRAWYDTLVNYLLCNGFQRGKIDQTLFIKRQKGHILLVQIYVDDIIFGSTKNELCYNSEKERHFISQDIIMSIRFYEVHYNRCNVCLYSTDLEKPLVQDGDAADVDEHLYRSMI
ncbi:ribonuclease H-like domain-containing protein [Tanacetum coccineum]